MTKQGDAEKTDRKMPKLRPPADLIPLSFDVTAIETPPPASIYFFQASFNNLVLPYIYRFSRAKDSLKII